MDGSVGKIMGMFNLGYPYNITNTTTTMGSITVQKYEDSTLDTYLNTTWYNTLSTEVKNAIIPESIVCDAWYFDDTGDPDYTGTYGTSAPGTDSYTISKYTGGTLNIGNRNVFALSVQDVINYLSDESMRVDTTAMLRNVNLWKMFWNDEITHSDNNICLRSSLASDSRNIWVIAGGNGLFGYYSSTTGSLVDRPALNLDFTKISFTIKS